MRRFFIDNHFSFFVNSYIVNHNVLAVTDKNANSELTRLTAISNMSAFERLWSAALTVVYKWPVVLPSPPPVIVRTWSDMKLKVVHNKTLIIDPNQANHVLCEMISTRKQAPPYWIWTTAIVKAANCSIDLEPTPSILRISSVSKLEIGSKAPWYPLDYATPIDGMYAVACLL